MKTRSSGILLHITSLPSPYGIGDLGPAAYRFADFLSQAGPTVWQVLPLTPTTRGAADSPYVSTSAFAGNPLLISPELMVRDGLLEEVDLDPYPGPRDGPVDYTAAAAFRERLFDRAFSRFGDRVRDDAGYRTFCETNAAWLEDFALFTALCDHFEYRAWSEWPREIRDREPDALRDAGGRLQDRVEREKFLQFVFFRQWGGLKSHCNEKGIRIFGDVPIYVDFQSADLWANPQLFQLDHERRPSVVAGVPPDYFSETGQRWGNPLYDWEALRATGYDWWMRRMGHNLGLFDLVRVDHFRGFVGFWEISAAEELAVNGRWVHAPADDFFRVLFERFPGAPIIAEDLGVITPDVREVMDRFGMPGMKVLLFAFGEDLPTNAYAPHNHVARCVLYTGTHDNNTVRGWFEGEASEADKERLSNYVGRPVTAGEVHWDLIRLAQMSVANLVIVPMQDVLGLDGGARMNLPATTEGNWQWRLRPDQLDAAPAQGLRSMAEIYGRL